MSLFERITIKLNEQEVPLNPGEKAKEKSILRNLKKKEKEEAKRQKDIINQNKKKAAELQKNWTKTTNRPQSTKDQMAKEIAKQDIEKSSGRESSRIGSEGSGKVKDPVKPEQAKGYKPKGKIKLGDTTIGGKVKIIQTASKKRKQDKVKQETRKKQIKVKGVHKKGWDEVLKIREKSKKTQKVLDRMQKALSTSKKPGTLSNKTDELIDAIRRKGSPKSQVVKQSEVSKRASTFTATVNKKRVADLERQQKIATKVKQNLKVTPVTGNVPDGTPGAQSSLPLGGEFEKGSDKKKRRPGAGRPEGSRNKVQGEKPESLFDTQLSSSKEKAKQVTTKNWTRRPLQSKTRSTTSTVTAKTRASSLPKQVKTLKPKSTTSRNVQKFVKKNPASSAFGGMSAIGGYQQQRAIGSSQARSVGGGVVGAVTGLGAWKLAGKIPYEKLLPGKLKVLAPVVKSAGQIASVYGADAGTQNVYNRIMNKLKTKTKKLNNKTKTKTKTKTSKFPAGLITVGTGENEKPLGSWGINLATDPSIKAEYKKEKAKKLTKQEIETKKKNANTIKNAEKLFR